MKNLCELIGGHEDWLMARILDYAKKRDFTKYTSTLVEAWRLSVSGLSSALIDILNQEDIDLELSPDDKYTDDPASAFGILEAKRHRQRGISLAMFLGLMKYYRQAYLDLVERSDFSPDEKKKSNLVIERYFDRVEIGFCVEWKQLNNPELVEELQSSNRKMTNQKNKYLTIFESLPHPAILLDSDSMIENMNTAATELTSSDRVSGDGYYFMPKTDYVGEGNPITKQPLDKVFPWLVEPLASLTTRDRQEGSTDLFLSIDDTVRVFSLHFSAMRDVSGKFSGTVIILEDITERLEKNKLQAAIETSGAVCHELNQPLQTLTMRLELLSRKSTEFGGELDNMLDQVERMAEITRRLTGVTEYRTKNYLGHQKILDISTSRN